MKRDTRGSYRFGPMPSWYAHRQIAHDHEGLARRTEPRKTTSGEVRCDDVGTARTSPSAAIVSEQPFGES